MNKRNNIIVQPITTNQQVVEQLVGEQLESAFQLFNEYSTKLANSYSALEDHVTKLTTELVDARNERLSELAEKEILAVKLEGLLDALPAGIIVLDDDNYITQVNPVARSMLLEDDDMLIGKDWDLISRESIVNNGNELQLKNSQWHECYINISICSLTEGEMKKLAGKIILISDITETRTLQNNLNREKRLSSLGEMIASLAHQIRTPLASALLYISALSHPKSNDNEERLTFAKKAKERLYHLERMVNDMLIFARGDVSDLDYINVYEFMLHLKKLSEDDHRINTINIHIDKNLKEVKIQANHDSLLSAVQNIIDNAIEACHERYAGTADNNDAEIIVKSFLNDLNQFQININDNGCGMSDEIKDRILEPFYTTHTNGTGLGLAVVSATVKRYFGEMTVKSNLGIGSEFIIKFPRPENITLLSSSLSATNKNIKHQSGAHNKLLDKQEVVI